MDSREAELSRVGKMIRARLDTESAEIEELRFGRKIFVDRVIRRNTHRAGRRSSRFIVARRFSFALASALAVLAGVLMWRQHRPIAFQIDSDAGPLNASGNAGDLIEANAATPTALRFSEGSSIVLERAAQLRVLSLDANGARVLIEKGTADVAIAHPGGPGKWRFEAGPVTVDVTGTRFRIDWNPEDRSFGIELKEGSVVVGGDCLPQPRKVQRGESLRFSCNGAVPIDHSDHAKTGVPSLALSAPSPAPMPALAGATEQGPAHTPRASTRAEPHEARASDEADWRALVAAGHYAEGVHAAERVGWTQVCRTANAVELLALADAARLSNQLPRAVDAMLTLRRRFPGTSSAATCAFSLGRMAFEQRGAYAEAARWFATYADEQPQGPLLGDALGRLMEARTRAGDRNAAHRDAERYLQRFPDGPYAGTARAILAE